MPHFYHEQAKLLISTSYKVMFTRLVYEKSLRLVPVTFLPRALEKGADFYVIVRSPCSRLSSFFKDKFRRNILNQKPGKIRWQDCQRLFFPMLGLDEQTNDNSKRQRFLQTSFSDFVHCLPGHYHLDAHLQPQYFLFDEIFKACLSLSISGEPAEIGMFATARGSESILPDFIPYQLIHLESRSETSTFSRRSGINLGRKVNATQDVNLGPSVVDKAIDITLWQKVYQLYHLDFKFLGYAQPCYCHDGGSALPAGKPI